LSIEIIYQYGNGFKITNRIRYQTKDKNIDDFIIDETQIRVGSQYFWLWVGTIKPKHRQILQIDIFWENMLIVKRFIASLIKTYDKHSIYR
jgi:transposase-like protein